MKSHEIGRRNLCFNLDNKQQKLAYDYLGLLGRSQSIFIGKLVGKFLEENGIRSVTKLHEEDAKELSKNIDTINNQTSSTELTQLATMLSSLILRNDTKDTKLSAEDNFEIENNENHIKEESESYKETDKFKNSNQEVEETNFSNFDYDDEDDEETNENTDDSDIDMDALKMAMAYTIN